MRCIAEGCQQEFDENSLPICMEPLGEECSYEAEGFCESPVDCPSRRLVRVGWNAVKCPHCGKVQMPGSMKEVR